MAANINIVSTLDDKSIKTAQRELDKLSENTKGFSKKMGESLKNAGGEFVEFGKKIGVAVIAAGAGAVVLGKKLIDAGERASTSNSRITQIADSMDLFGDSTSDVTKRLIDLAEATARNTGVDQNAIKETQAKLLTFAELGKTANEVGGQFDRATQAAIDMAAAGFGSAENNAVQLGKALNDPIKGITALAKSGVTFTEVEKDRIKELVESNRIGEAQALVLEAIEKQVGGTAAATANASDRMKVAFSQLQERLGQKLLPVFERVTAFMIDKVFPVLENLATKGFAKLREIIDRVRPTVVKVATALRNALQPIIERIGKWMADNTDVVKVFFGVLAGIATVAAIAGLAATLISLANPVVLIIGAIAALAAGIYYAYTRFEGFRNVVDTVWQAIQTAVGFIVDEIVPRLITGFQVAADVVKTIFGFIVDNVIPPLVKGFEVAFNLVRWYIDNIMKPAFDIYVSIVRTAVRIAKPIIQTIVTVVTNVVKGIKWAIDNIFKPAFDVAVFAVQVAAALIAAPLFIMVELVSAMITAVKWAFDNIFKPVWNTLSGFISGVIDKLQPVIDVLRTIIEGVIEGVRIAIDYVFKPIFKGLEAFFNGVKRVIEPIIDAIGSVFTGMADIIKGAFDTAKGAVKTGWNGLASVWNSTLGKFSFTVPSWVPGLGGKNFSMPNMPYLETGGPVPGAFGQPTPIVAHGGEFVLSADVVNAIKRGAPTRGLKASQASTGIATGGNVINITVTSADPQAVVEAIRRYNRTNGPAPIAVA
jgi:phage-related protein